MTRKQDLINKLFIEQLTIASFPDAALNTMRIA